MSNVDQQELAVGRLYAGSTLALALEQGIADEILEDLAGFERLLDARPELQRLQTPLVKAEARRKSLEKLFRNRMNDLLVDSLQIMSRKGRLGLVRAFIAAYREEYDKAKGRVEVGVTTAVALSPASRQRLEKAAGAYLGKKVRLVEKIDSDVVGGVMLQVGDRKMDTTVARELARANERLLERSSQEVLRGTAYKTAEQ